MKNHLLLTCAALCWSAWAAAESLPVTNFRYAGPYEVKTPFAIDSVDVQSRKFSPERLLEAPLSADLLSGGSAFAGEVLPGCGEGYALHLVGFTVENERYAKAKLHIEGLKHYQLFVDGKKTAAGDLALEPATHAVVIKYLSEAGKADSLRVKLETDGENLLTLKDEGKRLYTLRDVMLGTRYAGVDLSPDGKYLITAYRTTREGGKSSITYRVSCPSARRTVAERSETLRWMPRSNRFYYTRDGVDGRELVTVDPATLAETVIAQHLPDGFFQVAPSEDYLLFSVTAEGPSERKDIYEVLTPDDRQPGWRERSSLAKFDLRTGLLQPLTFGYHNAWAADISSDGRYVLVMSSRDRLERRPTTLFSLYRLDVQTLRAELLIDGDGFINGARFSPDGSRILLSGSPEALGGIGKNVREGQIPSMTDGQLFLFDINTKKAQPLTKYFNPSVQRADWSRADGKIYLTAEDRDRVSLFRLDPDGGKCVRLEVPEDIVSGFALADGAAALACYGQGASNSDRLYAMDTKRLKTEQLEDLSREILRDVQLGDCRAWDFVNSRGDTICGRFYLPPHFDSSKSYPLIVNYYGGCSPVERTFESRYPHHAYAALGYVVYVVEPSGATGFGQEFSARHVNTAGKGVAEDIIEGTRKFCDEHPYVNKNKIGCIGASYGGFMTQYLQTQTDLFAAAISHAGISDHTSYWGEGYWGYSYSEVSMAGSYPWSDPDLYVKQSPLYNADKIHTPLLFLHGDADTNVPVGESIQMFTALKLLGRETAFVAVKDQNHHILNYDQRIRWQNTIFAWFAKWLQDDASWWNALYPPKSL